MSEYESAAEKAREDLEVHADLLTWTAVHGSLQLAMRHPAIHNGPTRAMVQAFVNQLGDELVRRRFLTRSILEEGHRVEAEFRRDILRLPPDKKGRG